MVLMMYQNQVYIFLVVDLVHILHSRIINVVQSQIIYFIPMSYYLIPLDIILLAVHFLMLVHWQKVIK